MSAELDVYILLHQGVKHVHCDISRVILHKFSWDTISICLTGKMLT